MLQETKKWLLKACFIIITLIKFYQYFILKNLNLNSCKYKLLNI